MYVLVHCTVLVSKVFVHYLCVKYFKYILEYMYNIQLCLTFNQHQYMLKINMKLTISKII